MHIKSSPTVILTSLFILAAISPGWAQEGDFETSAVLSSAESFFQSMQKMDYARVWEYLTQNSKDTIVQDTIKAMKSHAKEYSVGHVMNDFACGEALSQAYWNAFMKNFDPIMVLEQSKWEIESVKSDKAEIRILYKKASNPAILRMFKEQGIWKAGLVESFWTRKR
jgi:hypothetical protein